MKVKPNRKAESKVLNHTKTLAPAIANAGGLKVKTHLKAGYRKPYQDPDE